MKKSGGIESEKELPVTGMWSFPPTLQERGQDFKLSDLDLRFMDKVNYDELEKRLKNNSGQTNKLFSITLDFFLPAFYSDYYLIEEVSDFWKYQVGETVSLLRIPANPRAAESSCKN